MTFAYDDKGKFFTDVISKTPIPALVQTTTHLIKGFVHVRKDERVKDELERDGHFLALTDASVSDAEGKILYKKEFIAIHKDQIVWIIPDEKILERED
ncbi:MAG: hypothetical protein HN855_13170 [Anaerolineae bacterium]|mgnify:CR=1 FL=1|jgi:hypothetical protein|nr:hypothetical protein [Anaerolineae bacterium]MBT7072287.1 hypothetical protein [Anaerolineae bacterium]MBT7326104.1 hypothetical protein [Anaerolineae bacterium]MBT7601769.1 hypothetical protein [Anaerolineae bacterium]